MKKIHFIFALVFYLSVLSYGQSKLEPPLGLTFGSDIETTTAILKNKGTFNDEQTQRYGKSISYLNMKIGVLMANIVILKFSDDNKLFDIRLIFVPSNDDIIEETYNEICSIITTKYGEGESFKHFKPPFKAGDKDFLRGIKEGRAEIATFWKNFEEKGDNILVEIEDYENITLIVIVNYQNGKLNKIVEEKMNKLNTSDF